MIVLQLCCRQKKKDEPQHEVVYRLVSTDNNCGDGQISVSPGSKNKLATTTINTTSSRPPSDPDSHRSNPVHGSYEFRDVEPELGSEEYEYSQIRVIPGSGDALALHQGAPPATDPLDDPDGFYSHDATIPDISRFHGYHAISPILGNKEHRSMNRQNNGGGYPGTDAKGDMQRETLSGEYDNINIPPSTRYPVDNYTTIHQFIHPHNASTPHPPKLNGVNGGGAQQGYGQPPPPPKSTFNAGYAPVLRSNGHMGLEDGHKDLESMYAKPNKQQQQQRNAKGAKNGRNGAKPGHGVYH